MGKSKKRPGVAAKIQNRKTQEQMAIRRRVKAYEKQVEDNKASNIQRLAERTKNNFEIDPVTNQIMSPRDAMIKGLANNHKDANGLTSTSSLLTNIYGQ